MKVYESLTDMAERLSEQFENVYFLLDYDTAYSNYPEQMSDEEIRNINLDYDLMEK